jgi:hypothetical protein
MKFSSLVATLALICVATISHVVYAAESGSEHRNGEKHSGESHGGEEHNTGEYHGGQESHD